VKDSKWIGFDTTIRGVHIRIAVSHVTMAFEWKIQPNAANMQVAKDKASKLAEVATTKAGARAGEHWEVFIEGEAASARRHV
jgi:hypothetical protein